MTSDAGGSALDQRPVLVSIVGATATGKSALGIALARQWDGEIVSCDSTAVYRGFDIGTDKVPLDEQQGVPHHLVDVADPHEDYSAARYAIEAAVAVRAITARGRLPILVGGTGLYYRALVRGLFPGPGRDVDLRARLHRIAARRGAPALHRWLARVDSSSAARIHAQDEKRLVRALEVYLLTGRPLTTHFAATRSPIAEYEMIGLALDVPLAPLADRLARRVDAQFEAGLLHEIRGLLASGVREDAHPFGGLVYRQAIEHLRGVRDEGATRQLIARENRRYARRQLIWFRKEPNLIWLHAWGHEPDALEQASGAIAHRLKSHRLT